MGWGITVAPAYGRDYKTAAEAWRDWLDYRDFCIRTPGYPSYINNRDAEKYGVPDNKITIRYNRLALFLITTMNETKEWSYIHDADLEAEWNASNA